MTKELIREYEGLRFPSGITISKDGENSFAITLQEKNALSNMQVDAAAFEAWAICIKSVNDLAEFKIGIDNIKAIKKTPQFNQLLYRMHKFSVNYDWVELEDDVKEKYNEIFASCGKLVVNYPQSPASEVAKNVEAQLEREYVEKYESEDGVIAMSTQLPLGVFKCNVAESNRLLPKSSLDIWAVKTNELSIYELKAKGNNSVGIISELMYYCNIIRDIQKGTFGYEEAASKSNFRKFDVFYKNMKNKSVKGCFLADSLHSFIEAHLEKILKIMSRGKGGIDYEYIRYADTISIYSAYNEQQRTHQINLLTNSNIFDKVNAGGYFMGEYRNFCLEEGKEEMNLFSSIRGEDKVTKYFNENKISFWGNGKTIPNHLLSSQVACLNFLFPIRDNHDMVLEVAKMMVKNSPYEQELEGVELLNCDAEDTRGYIAFEVVSKLDHLNESKQSSKGLLQRGELCTSIDAVILGRLKSGKHLLIPIEWKYTESYNRNDKSTEGEMKSKGLERQRRYNILIENSTQLVSLENYEGSIFYQEPFYQLMRQTLWAEQMIEHQPTEYIKADDYIHVHVVPKDNDTLRNKGFEWGTDMESAWTDCLSNEGKKRYCLVEPSDIITALKDFASNSNDISKLVDYLNIRYNSSNI